MTETMGAEEYLHDAPRSQIEPWLVWAPVLAGILLLYLPTYIDLGRVFWKLREGTAAPVMVILAGWLLLRERSVLARFGANDGKVIGIVLFGLGTAMYIVGRSQTFYQFEVGSQIPLLLGITGILLGRAGLRRLAVPIFFLVFLVPVPGTILDQLLLPLKEWVSDLVDESLHLAGYPIARIGVVLSIGPYNLLVADACAGLHSMAALLGIGLFYTYLATDCRPWAKVTLMLSALPIAMMANVLRVAGLTLVTYHFGEATGVKFHDIAAYLEVLLAFTSFFAVERLLLWIQNHQAFSTRTHA